MKRAEAFLLDLNLAAALGVVALACVLVYRWRAQFKLWVFRLAAFFTPEERLRPHPLWSLFLVSFVALYTEIMLIRWIGTEVRVFAYFQNLALIACFLGFGLGCYWSERRKTPFFSLVALAALVALVHAPIDAWKFFLVILSNQLSLSPDAALWGYPGSFFGETAFMLFLASAVVIAAFLLLLALTMVPLGQWVGFYLDRVGNPVSGYSVNLLGSVAGIWIFAGMAFLWLPPEYWFGLAFLLLLLIPPRSVRLGTAGALIPVASLILLWYSGTRKPTYWSPYQKLAHSDTRKPTYWSPYQKLDVTNIGDHQYWIDVNNTGYMVIANTTRDFLARNPPIAQQYRAQSSYDAPFRFVDRCDRVLIVGAGAGNDVSAALRNGAARIDAVEIDPVILSLGEKLHPDQPYSSPKVHKVLTDARAYLRQTQQRYDVMLFGLLDSQTQFSGYSNVRVDNYVYTQEAFREARRLLRPGGVLILKFEVRHPWTWMGQRFYAMLARVFGRPPIVFYARQLGAMAPATVFITSDDPGLWSRASRPELAELIAAHPPQFPLDSSGAPPMTTDDWPYVYHQSRSIPSTYLTISVILLAMVVLSARRVLEPAQVSTWRFFFLGAGFLLLETQLISRLALYFGTTWLVNCVALTAILLVLLAANLYVARGRPSRFGRYYVLLVAFLIASYLFPWDRLPYGTRTVGILLSAAYAFPVFFAGVIFTETFRRCEQKSGAFGVNMIGAVVGGLTQNASFILGMKMLLPIAALFYVSASVCGLLASRQPATQSLLTPT